MVFIKNLSKNFGKRVLFENVTLNINRGEKIGLVGPNGAGKSTLFSFILGETEPTAGSIQIMKGVHIGYLPQEAKFNSQRTVLGELTEGDSRISRLKKEKEELEDSSRAGEMRYGDVLHELEVLGFFELEHKAKKILTGLGFKQSDFDRPVQHLSGGWQMRTLLAKLLTFQYDLLLLDEPTNYLDLNAALWLEDYLAKFRGTFVMISHDKAFLTDVTNYTLVLEYGKLYKVTGNYSHYEQIREERRTHLQKQSKEQIKKQKQLIKFVHRFHGQPNKAAQVRAKKRVLENIEENEVVVPPDPRESIGDFQFPQTKKSGYKVITFDKVCKSYSEVKVYEDLDLEINQDKKIVLVGDNGAGKSTLLKMLAGVVDIDSGERNVGYHVDTGYFSQTRMDVLTEHNTVLDEAYTAVSGFRREESVRTILGAFFFSGDDVEKKVSVLSGGEKSRLILAKLLINPPNFLLLDEPTTHLDVDAVEALVRALKSYQGTLVFISHDIYFVRSVANCCFEVKEGKIREFSGNFDYYLEKRKEELTPTKKQRVKHEAAGQKQALSQNKKKEEEKLRKEKKKQRKAFNASIGNKINKLKRNREALALEAQATQRAIERPHKYRDAETIKEHELRLGEIEKKIKEIDLQIESLEDQLNKKDK